MSSREDKVSDGPESLRSGNAPKRGEERTMYVSRDRAVSLLRSVGFRSNVEQYTNKELAGKLRHLPEREIEQPEDDTLTALLTDVLDAAESGGVILVTDDEDKGEIVSAEEGSVATATKAKVRKGGSTKSAVPSNGNGNGSGKHHPSPHAIREVSNKKQRVTPGLALEFRDMAKFPRERHLTKSRRDFLKGVIARGEFFGNKWASVRVKENGDTYRMNGLGTSTAFCDLFDSGREDIEATVDVIKYECDTMEDAARLYAAFDPKQSARTKGNILQAYASGSDKLTDVPNRVIKLAAAGLAYAKHGKDYRKRSVEEQAQLILDHDDFVAWLSGVLTSDRKNPPKHMLRMPVVAAISTTYLAKTRDVAEFWDNVRDDPDVPKTDPRRVLRNWLLTHNFGALSAKGDKTIASDREGYVVCLQAWNAWVKGDAAWKPKYNKSTEPPEIA